MSVIFGILAGIGMPIQTSINAKLKVRLGSPYNSSLVSFFVSLAFLVILILITGQSLMIPFGKLSGEPVWIWGGGVCGVIFLTSNIIIISKLGSVQTVVLPVLGQILMGLAVDSLGLFYGQQSQLTVLRIIGAVLVAAGVIMVSMARDTKRRNTKKRCDEPKKGGLWIWRIFGVIAGMLSATQTAVNGYLGTVLDSPLKATLISFIVGIVFLCIVCLITNIKNRPQIVPREKGEKNQWWMWLGGILGALYVLANVYISGMLGTGLTVIILLIGSTTGGLLIDHFGLLGSAKNPINIMKVAGVAIMIAGAAAIKLF